MKYAFTLSAACGLFVFALAGCGGGNNNGGSTTPTATPTATGIPSTTQTFTQADRLARPVVNEVFATFANGRHFVNDTDNPNDDPGQLANDIQTFMVGTAGRSQETTDFVKKVLVPDVMIADLSQPVATAAYLGSETGGVTGSKFGGRALRNDVVDTSLGVVFGGTVAALGGAPDDKKEIPTLTSDNVGPGAKNYMTGFPYLGTPK